MASPLLRTLEITVISGEDLRNDRRPIKKNAFVVVRTDSYNSRRTDMDTDGGSCPKWNQKLVVDMSMHAQFITLQVQCKTSLGDKTVGTARIPVSDFVGGYVPESYLHFLSYRLRDHNGERNGIVNISVRVKVPEYASCSRTELGIPLGILGQRNFGGGIVTGVPVSCNYPVK
ncbi:BON1-associated protein 2 [Quercus robur]|uniref:BON1-associated protein 2 n=1 Tax=Quercus robur TaxID=38942 RepID=UPI0021625B42|nr:BON1-associated protein 2 [Quercus robur]